MALESLASIAGGVYNFVRITPRRSIGDLVAQATLEEVHGDDLELVDHPVDRSSSITDHAFKIPEEVRIHVVFSDSDVNSSLQIGGGSATSAGITIPGVANPIPSASQLAGVGSKGALRAYDQLLKWQANAVLLTIQTGKRLYRDMVIKNLNVATTSRTENCVDATITARRVILAQTVVTSITASEDNQAIPQVTNPVARYGEVPLGKLAYVQDGPTVESFGGNTPKRDR